MSDKYKHRFENEFNKKEFLEYVFYHCSIIWEIMDLIYKNLYKRLIGEIDENILAEVKTLYNEIKSGKINEIIILKEIRNKHSFHIAFDPQYADSFFTDELARYDLPIGLVGSNFEKDMFFNFEDRILIAYLERKFKMEPEEIFDLMMSSLEKYSHCIHELFKKIFKDITKNSIYMI